MPLCVTLPGPVLAWLSSFFLSLERPRPLIIVEETALRKLLLEAVFLGRQERTYRRRKSAEGKSQQYDTIFRVSRSSGRVSVEETDRQVFQSPSGKLLRTSFPDEFS